MSYRATITASAEILCLRLRMTESIVTLNEVKGLVETNAEVKRGRGDNKSHSPNVGQGLAPAVFI